MVLSSDPTIRDNNNVLLMTDDAVDGVKQNSFCYASLYRVVTKDLSVDVRNKLQFLTLTLR